jgi:hypothetical protein
MTIYAKLYPAMVDARYKVLVAIRPIAPARSAFDITLQGVIDSLDRDADHDLIEKLKTLFLN